MLKTWDIFDTLITRKGILPRSIFVLIQQKAKIRSFEMVRIEAEQSLIRRGVRYTIDDIYDELHNITKLPKETCEKLKNLEIELEIEQCIPIVENLRQVKAGDILISDMYLSEKIIRKMLDKAGLFAPVEIIITNHGKSSGEIWQQFAEKGKFLFHIGDNINSDIKNAYQAGFDASFSKLSFPTEFEVAVAEKDYKFSAYLREIRLRNPFTEEIKRKYWELFTMNVGMLIVLVQLIDDLQKKYGFEYLGFCGRDMYYLWLLYKRYKEDIGEEPPANDYLYYSRKLVRRCRSELAEYFSYKIAGRKALMIDLTGTGMTFHRLRTQENIPYSSLVCFKSEYDITKSYPYEDSYPENWITFRGKIKDADISYANFRFIRRDDTHAVFITLENFNRSNHNSPVRLDNFYIDDKLITNVIFSEICDTENFDVFDACFHEVLKSEIEWGGIPTEKPLSLLKVMLSIFGESSRHVVLKERHMTDEDVNHQLKFYIKQE